MTKGGKQMRFRAVIVMGDKIKRVGLGVAKGLDVQQAVEKALKAFLVFNDIVFEKIHNLTVLVELCKDKEPDFGDYLETAAILTPYATAYRYPNEFFELEPDESQLITSSSPHDGGHVLAPSFERHAVFVHWFGCADLSPAGFDGAAYHDKCRSPADV